MLLNEGVPIVFPEAGHVLYLGSGAELQVLAVTRRGFAPLNPPEWIAALDPDLLLLSVEPCERLEPSQGSLPSYHSL